MEGVLNVYVTNPNPTPTLTPNLNRNPNSNPNQINEKIQKETTLEIDQITKCQFGRWKLVKTYLGLVSFLDSGVTVYEPRKPGSAGACLGGKRK
jgi:hypothetical protein